MTTNVDVLVVGGGPAGMAAAVGAREAGASVVILERERALGGILRQCVHTGFGLKVFGEELSGPEYAQRYIDKVLEADISYFCDTTVLDISSERVVTAVNSGGLLQVFAGSIVLAMGARERPRGALGIPGTRPAGVITAGTAQRFVNLEGLLPGRRAVILGSGDIGLIMARRLTFEGCEVAACVELLPYSSGLRRNIAQCLDDFDIPLYLSHTVVDIKGRERVEGVTIVQVDKNRNPIPGTEREIPCDTLLLSVGLIPENELSRTAGVDISATTSGPIVDNALQTSVPGIFAAGNVLHIHDLVDYVSEEAEMAGRYAAQYALNQISSKILTNAIDAPNPLNAIDDLIHVTDGFGVSGCVPQYVRKSALREPLRLMFRPRNVFHNAAVAIDFDGEHIYRKKHRILTPGEIATVKLPLDLFYRHVYEITVRIECD